MQNNLEERKLFMKPISKQIGDWKIGPKYLTYHGGVYRGSSFKIHLSKMDDLYLFHRLKQKDWFNLKVESDFLECVRIINDKP